jgi:hypothetical protein
VNKSKAEDDIFYGDHAETLLSNPAYRAALTRIKARLYEGFGATGIFQKRKREELWKMQRVIDDFEQELELMIRDSAIAKQDIQEEQRLKQVR